MSLAFLEWPVRKQLATETNTLNRLRIKVLAYILHLRILSMAILLVFYLSGDYSQQTIRVAGLLVTSILFYVALSMGLPWKKAIHTAVMIFMLIIWGNLLLVDNFISLVTLQYAVILIVCAFYGLGSRWGVIYSFIVLLAFLTFLLTGHTVGSSIPLGAAGSVKIAVGLLLINDLIFLILVHYYFFSSFNETIRTLDARTVELTANLGLQQELQQKQKEEMVHQMHLLASISHDIKSPLRFLMITTGRLATSYPDLPTVRAISQSSYRLYNFMKNLLEYTEFRYKNTGITFSYMDLNELVAQKFEIFSAQAVNQSNTLVNEVSPGVIVKSNLQLVGIILHNLIDNANKVTSHGNIIVKVEDHRNELHLIVCDDGQGMNPEIRNWINSQAKVPGPDDNPQSFGMGLLIVKEISTLIKVKLLAVPFQPRGTAIHIIFSKNNPGS